MNDMQRMLQELYELREENRKLNNEVYELKEENRRFRDKISKSETVNLDNI